MGLFISAAHAASDSHGEDAGSGLPQMAWDTFPSQIFWLVVALVVLYFILSRAALPKISGAIEARHDAIEDDLDRAADLKRKAEEAEQAYEAALADARASAQAIAADTRAAIQKDLDEATAKADAEISAKAAESEARIAEIRDSALQSVEEVAGDVAAAIVTTIAPSAADDAALNSAVADKMKG